MASLGEVKGSVLTFPSLKEKNFPALSYARLSSVGGKEPYSLE